MAGQVQERFAPQAMTSTLAPWPDRGVPIHKRKREEWAQHSRLPLSPRLLLPSLASILPSQRSSRPSTPDMSSEGKAIFWACYSYNYVNNMKEASQNMTSRELSS